MSDWQDISTAPKGEPLQLLYDFPGGAKPVESTYRSGRFWGRETEGWWAPEGGMWIDGWIKGWRHPPAEQPA